MMFSQAKKSIIVRLARSKIRGKINIAIMQLTEGRLVFRYLLHSLSHSLDLNFPPFEKLLSSYLLSVMGGFRNLLNVSAALAYGKNKRKKKVLYLKFQENWRSLSTSNSWRINTCGSPVRLITKSIFHFQHIWPKKRHAIRKYE